MQRPFAKVTTSAAAAAVLALLGGLAPLTAQAAGHYVPGVEGIQNASVPPPGFYYLGYLVHYDINSFRAPGSSSNLPGSNKGNVTALANRFVWMTGHKLLGADYGVEAIVPIVRTSLKVVLLACTTAKPVLVMSTLAPWSWAGTARSGMPSLPLVCG